MIMSCDRQFRSTRKWHGPDNNIGNKRIVCVEEVVP